MKKTKIIKIGGIEIGGGNPVAIQSMTNTDTRNVGSTCAQIAALKEAGCEIVRVAVPDLAAAKAIFEIKKKIEVPLVADIHFDYKLALAAIESGCDKLRINPGNIGGVENVKLIAEAAGKKNIPIRVGVNAGSLEREIYKKHGGVTAEGLVESALGQVEILEKQGFDNIVVAVKTHSVPMNISAYMMLAEQTNYPIHIGVTEAGGVFAGSIRSAVGIGALLADGIGDTMRVSLTGDPLEEVRCAKEILKSLELRKFGVEIISCPTCGRTEIDLARLADEVEKRCADVKKNIKVAVMGCVVNGPGEARDADVGVAGGKGKAVLFKNGETVGTVDETNVIQELMALIEGY